MRKILFRGKRVSNGEWVYGVPIQCYDGDWQICTDYSKLTVVPETVGQYTGLTDKNGKKIFEGDIVKINYSIYGDEVDFEGKVFFDNAKFLIKAKDGIVSICNYLSEEIEVIGNIHDNPELIESEVEE